MPSRYISCCITLARVGYCGGGTRRAHAEREERLGCSGGCGGSPQAQIAGPRQAAHATMPPCHHAWPATKTRTRMRSATR